MKPLYPSEHEEQAAVVKWARKNGLDLLFAIPNGGYRSMSEAKRLSKEGVQAGVPDLFLCVPRNGKHGLFIEMKAMKGKVSPLQKVWLEVLNKQGYEAVVCHGAEAAIEVIKKYLGDLKK